MRNSAANAARRLLPKNRFARNVSVLAGGTAAGQLVIVASSPVLTRLYSPEDFGLLAVYAGLIGMLGVIASLRYQLAIPLPESDQEAAAVTVLSLLVVAFMTALIGVGVSLFGTRIVKALNTPALEPYLWLIPVGLFLMGGYQVVQFWAIRTRAFSSIARTRLSQALAMVGVQIGGNALGPVALLAGQAAGQAAGTSTLGILAVQKQWGTFRKVGAGSVAWAAKRYRRFPAFSSWEGALNTAGLQLPPILFATLFTPAAAGIYMLAHRVLAMPMKILGQAIANVFYSSAADTHREERLAPLVANIHGKLAHIAMPPALILLMAGPELFAFVFGAQWEQAGEFSQWMVPWIYLSFVTSPLSRLFSVMEKQVQGMTFQVILFAARMGSLVVGSYMGGLMFTVILFAINSAICWMGFLLWVMQTSGNHCRQAWQPSASAFGWGALLVAPLGLFYGLAEAQPLFFAALILSGALIAARYIYLMKSAW